MTVTNDRSRLVTDLQPECECATSSSPEWEHALRQEFVDAGYDAGRVDSLLAAAVERFRSGRVRDFVPLFVKRSVSRELHGR
jgi:hypothetical protein